MLCWEGAWLSAKNSPSLQNPLARMCFMLKTGSLQNDWKAQNPGLWSPSGIQRFSGGEETTFCCPSRTDELLLAAESPWLPSPGGVPLLPLLFAMNSFSGQPLLQCPPCFSPGLFKATPRLRCGRDESWMELNCLTSLGAEQVPPGDPLETKPLPQKQQQSCPDPFGTGLQQPGESASGSLGWKERHLEKEGSRPCYP